MAWTAVAVLAYEDWCQVGARLSVADRASSWWLGDWLRFGMRRYGRRYADAARLTGYDEKTLRNLVYVSGRYDVHRRHEDLSWSHHSELAALDAADQDRWLARASRERLSIQALRRELAAWRKRKHAVGIDGAAVPLSPAVVPDTSACPRCGYLLQAGN